MDVQSLRELHTSQEDRWRSMVGGYESRVLRSTSARTELSGTERTKEAGREGETVQVGNTEEGKRGGERGRKSNRARRARHEKNEASTRHRW